MLLHKIDADLKDALKSKDVVKTQTLRLLKAAINNYLIEKHKNSADDHEIIGLVQKQIKLRQEAIDSYQKASRNDLLQKELTEKSILQTYLPPQLTDQELSVIVKETIELLGAKTTSDRGRVMKELLPKLQGRADGTRVSDALSATLR